VKDYSLGKLTFVAKRINVPARPFATSVACFLCEEHVLVLPGNVMAVFVIERERRVRVRRLPDRRPARVLGRAAEGGEAMTTTQTQTPTVQPTPRRCVYGFDTQAFRPGNTAQAFLPTREAAVVATATYAQAQTKFSTVAPVAKVMT